jgi:ABC-type bacteriocin/lantibiotic exporter with double-glycine peptidase domain
MVAAYWEQPLYQADVAQWLDTQPVGTPASRIQRLRRHGFDVHYQTGSLAQLKAWIQQEIPCILFVRSGELSYWQIDTPHTVVLAGFREEQAVLFDPDREEAPHFASIDSLMLAWSYSDYTYAVMWPER